MQGCRIGDRGKRDSEIQVVPVRRRLHAIRECEMASGSRIQNHRDLKVWQLGMDICVQVHEISRSFPADEKFGLISQIRRSAASVPANIAEGHARSSTKDYLRHLSIALGSLAETATFIELASRLDFGNVDGLQAIYEMINEEKKMLRGLRSSLKKKLPPK